MHYAKYVWPDIANAELGVDEVEGFPEPWLLAHVPLMGGVALDVGANRGGWSRLLARRFERVYAMEPNPALHGELRSIAGTVVVPLGAWRIAGERDFVTYADGAHTSTHFGDGGINTGAPTGRVRLPVQRIDALDLPGQVDFVKIDVEGAEVEALEGAWRLLEYDRPLLVVEVHTLGAQDRVMQMLGELHYICDVVRRPYYAERDALWWRHFWIVARPAEMGG
jgi:FkbM family methyltransferase